jgi:hypothetical protein
MERSNTSTPEARDLANNSGSLLRTWGPPAALLVVNSIGEGLGWWGRDFAGVMESTGIFWIGVLCFKNGFHCGRAHCYFIGIFYPIMALLNLVISAELVNLSGNTFWTIFIVGTLLSFAPELFGIKYLKR